MYWTMRDISQKKHLLTILVNRMGINKDDFDKITQQYMKDPNTAPDFAKVQQEVAEGNFTESGEPAPKKHYTVNGVDKGLMTRDFCVDVHKKLHAMSLVYMKDLRKFEGRQLQMELTYIRQAFGDLLFNELGLEADDLDAATEYLDLDNKDEEYKKLCADYTKEVQDL
jgi:hypothetical protein